MATAALRDEISAQIADYEKTIKKLERSCKNRDLPVAYEMTTISGKFALLVRSVEKQINELRCEVDAAIDIDIKRMKTHIGQAEKEKTRLEELLKMSQSEYAVMYGNGMNPTDVYASLKSSFAETQQQSFKPTAFVIKPLQVNINGANRSVLDVLTVDQARMFTLQHEDDTKSVVKTEPAEPVKTEPVEPVRTPFSQPVSQEKSLLSQQFSRSCRSSTDVPDGTPSPPSVPSPPGLAAVVDSTAGEAMHNAESNKTAAVEKTTTTTSQFPPKLPTQRVKPPKPGIRIKQKATPAATAPTKVQSTSSVHASTNSVVQQAVNGSSKERHPRVTAPVTRLPFNNNEGKPPGVRGRGFDGYAKGAGVFGDRDRSLLERTENEEAEEREYLTTGGETNSPVDCELWYSAQIEQQQQFQQFSNDVHSRLGPVPVQEEPTRPMSRTSSGRRTSSRAEKEAEMERVALQQQPTNWNLSPDNDRRFPDNKPKKNNVYKDEAAYRPDLRRYLNPRTKTIRASLLCSIERSGGGGDEMSVFEKPIDCAKDERRGRILVCDTPRNYAASRGAVKVYDLASARLIPLRQSPPDAMHTPSFVTTLADGRYAVKDGKAVHVWDGELRETTAVLGREVLHKTYGLVNLSEHVVAVLNNIGVKPTVVMFDLRKADGALREDALDPEYFSCESKPYFMAYAFDKLVVSDYGQYPPNRGRHGGVQPQGSVLVLDSDWKVEAQFGDHADTDVQQFGPFFTQPSGVTIDSEENILVGNAQPGTVHLHACDGVFLGCVDFGNNAPRRPSGLYLTRNAELIVNDLQAPSCSVYRLELP